MKKYIEIEHRSDGTYANGIKIRPHIMQKYSPDSLDSLISEKKEEIKKLRREKRKNYDKWYYENKTKVNRNLAKQGLSIHNGTVFKHEYLNGGEITVKDVSNKPIPPDTI